MIFARGGITLRLFHARFPRGRDDAIEIGEARCKGDELARQRGVGDEHGRVAAPAGGMYERHRATGDALDGRDDAAHRSRLAGAEVEGKRSVAGIEMAQRLDMRRGEIAHMDEVAFAGSVSGRVVGAED